LIFFLPDLLPVDCSEQSRNNSYLVSCKVGNETNKASCNNLMYEVSWSKSGKVTELRTGQQKDDMKTKCIVSIYPLLQIEIVKHCLYSHSFPLPFFQTRHTQIQFTTKDVQEFPFFDPFHAKTRQLHDQ